MVGGGIVGASAALFYKRRYPRHRVILLERGPKPSGASTRNAGFACIGSISEHEADLKDNSAENVLDRICRRYEGLKFLRETLPDDETRYEPCGGIEVFTHQPEFEACRQKIDFWNRELEARLGEANIYREMRVNGLHAIENRVEGGLHSGWMMMALYRRLQEAGVETWWNHKVTRVSGHQTEAEIQSLGSSAMEGGPAGSKGVMFVPALTLLAANGFTANLADTGIRPARGSILVTNPLPNLGWRGTFHYHEGYVYFRNVGDRLMLGGARHIATTEEETMEFGVHPMIRSWLMDFAEDVLKLPEGWHVDQEWSGIMGMAPHKEPVLRETEEGVWVAAGLSGMGVAIGMNLARTWALGV